MLLIDSLIHPNKRGDEMKLFIISTDEYDYDEFDSMVISAENEEEARDCAKQANLPGDMKKWKYEEIGTYNKSIVCVVHSSFNAG